MKGRGSHLLRKDRVLSLQHAHQWGQMPEVRVEAGCVEVHHGGRTWSPGCTGQSEDGNPWWQGQCLSTATQNEEVARGHLAEITEAEFQPLENSGKSKARRSGVPSKLPRQRLEPAK